MRSAVHGINILHSLHSSNIFSFMRHVIKNQRFYGAKVLVPPPNYCLDMVRVHDYENFLCTLLLSNSIRRSAFAIRAFNIEVAKVQEQVSDARIGQMRFQFWQDTLDNVFKNDVPQHPVALELSTAIQAHKLQKRHLRQLITSRVEHLLSPTFKSLEAVEKYSEQSVSAVYYLLLQAAEVIRKEPAEVKPMVGVAEEWIKSIGFSEFCILNYSDEGIENIHADHVASHLGKAQGISNLIRSIPHNSQRRLLTFPQDILMKHNLSQESVLRGKQDKPIKDAVFDVASRANQHLEKARNLKSSLPKASNIVFLPAVSIESYLERLRKVDFDVFHPNLQRRNNILAWSLYWRKLLSRY